MPGDACGSKPAPCIRRSRGHPVQSLLLGTLLSHYGRHPVQAVFLMTGIVVANVLLVGTLLINAQARASYERGENFLRAAPIGQIRQRDAARNIDERTYLRLRLQGFDMLAPVLRRRRTPGMARHRSLRDAAGRGIAPQRARRG
jgi:hypothetical protein